LSGDGVEIDQAAAALLKAGEGDIVWSVAR
jgi:hypothetical protein